MGPQRTGVELLRGEFARFRADMQGRVTRAFVAPMPMELHRRKLARFEADMRARRVRHSFVAPLPYGLLWSLGLPLRPPLFQGFVPLALQAGVPAALMLGVILVMVGWGAAWDARTARFLVDAVLVFGAVVGVLHTANFRYWAERWRLGSWEEYPADPPEDASYVRETEQQGRRVMALP